MTTFSKKYLKQKKARRKFLIELIVSFPARLFFFLQQGVSLEVFLIEEKESRLFRFFLVLTGLIGWVGIVLSIING